MSLEFSKLICVVCSYQLSTFSQAKKNMIQAQKLLQNYSKKSKVKKCDKKIEFNDDEIIEEHLIDDEEFINEISHEVIIRDENEKIKCEFCEVHVVENSSQMKQYVERVS